MPLADKLQEAASKYIAEIVLGLVLSALAAIGLLADRLVPPTAFEALGHFATGHILLALCLAILGLVAWIVYLHPKLEFDRRVGAYVDRKTGIYYCAKCRTNRKNSPMKHRKNDYGWDCPACGLFYGNPDYEEPPKTKAKNLGPNSWMAR